MKSYFFKTFSLFKAFRFCIQYTWQKSFSCKDQRKYKNKPAEARTFSLKALAANADLTVPIILF